MKSAIFWHRILTAELGFLSLPPPPHLGNLILYMSLSINHKWIIEKGNLGLKDFNYSNNIFIHKKSYLDNLQIVYISPEHLETGTNYWYVK